jgi:hypothetical protein
MSTLLPLLSLTLVNQQAEPCDLLYGGNWAYWSRNPTSIGTNQTLSQVICQPRGPDNPVVDATLVIMQRGTPVWQMGFWCPATGANNVTGTQQGYGAISVRLSPWNSEGFPLVVTGTIIQTG